MEAQWSKGQQSKTETEAKSEEKNAEKDWLTQKALCRHFGSRQTALNYVRSCKEKGGDWCQYNQMASCWEYKLVRMKEEAVGIETVLELGVLCMA